MKKLYTLIFMSCMLLASFFSSADDKKSKKETEAVIALSPQPKIKIPQSASDIKQAKVEFEAFRKKLMEKESTELVMPFATHAMLILLDDTEKDRLGAMGLSLVQALRQKACPILVSASLLLNVLTGRLRRQHEEELFDKDKPKVCTTLSVQFQKWLNKENVAVKDVLEDQIKTSFKSMVNNESEVEKEKLLLCAYHPAFNPNEWIIAKPDDYMYLLIPRNYKPSGPLGDKNPTSKSVADVIVASADHKENELSEVELFLGLKIDHMEIKSNGQMHPERLLDDPILHADLSKIRGYFREVRDKIFVSRTEYEAHKKATKSSHSKIPLWAIYLDGHGSIGKSIASLNLIEYANFLNFLEKNIATKLFIVSSCYAAGFNENQVFKDFENPILPENAALTALKSAAQQYSFTIVTNALTDSVVSVGWGKSAKLDAATKSIDPQVSIDFSGFVQAITTADTINFADTIAHIIPSAKGIVQPVFFMSIPKIRLPGTQWFSVVDVDNRFGSIGAILAKTREEPLDVLTFFGKQKKQRQNLMGLLLYADVIPFELIINPTGFFALVPMLPQPDKTYYIAEISSETLTLQQIIYAFVQRNNLLSKRFIIGEISAKNNGVFSWEDKNAHVSIKEVILRQIVQDAVVTYELYFTVAGIYDENEIFSMSFTPADIEQGKQWGWPSDKNKDALILIKEVSEKNENKVNYDKESGFLLGLHFATAPRVHKKNGIKPIIKAQEKRVGQELVKYKALLNLEADKDFLTWATPHLKVKSKSTATVFDNYIKFMRAPLLKKQEDLKQKLTEAERTKLDMVRKLHEYTLLKRWHDALTTEQKNNLEAELKKQ